jgi:hypothetical protein
VAGEAVAGQEVEIFDGAVSKGKATVSGTGTWTLQLTGLSVAQHSIKARGLYGSNPESTVRTFTVAVATAPTITSVRDTHGDVGNGGSTTDTYVSLEGTAVAYEQVQIFDNGADKGIVSANQNRGWNTQILGLGLGEHRIVAKALYGDKPESNVRTFTVKVATPPLVIDTTPVTLGGKFYGLPAYPGHDPAHWPANTTITRVPSSGVAPYTYTSSDPLVASVNSGGFVNVATKKGTVTITVRDGAGQTASYSVSVTNVISVIGFGRNTYPVAVDAVSAAGLRLGTHAELNEIAELYSGRWPMGAAGYWTSDTCGLGKHYAKDLVSGGWSCVPSGPFGSHCNIVGLG